MWAAAGGHVAAVELLHSKRASMAPRQGGWDALMVAAASGHKDIVDWLLSHGMLFTNVNHKGKTAGDIAHARGHTELGEILNRMKEIKAWHDSNERHGITTAKMRENALRREATQSWS